MLIIDICLRVFWKLVKLREKIVPLGKVVGELIMNYGDAVKM